MKHKSKLFEGKNKISPFIRQLKIFIIFFTFVFFLWSDKLLRNNSSTSKTRRAKWLVKKLLELGPTFIKIGQSLSTRADLIPSEYVEEFSLLQDRVPAFDSKKAISIIEEELGKPISLLFSNFEPIPIAAASLGQVHKATLHTGDNVVVKVQRPGLEALFKLDFTIVKHLVIVGNFLFRDLRKFNLEEVYKEFFAILFREINYLNEGKNADRFRYNFKNYQKVISPKVYWEYTTHKILTLEYLPGIKIDDRDKLEANKISTQEVIKLGITCYLKQLLLDGFFQSDPHPGNMAVSGKGEIIFYDFGTMAEVQGIAQDRMVQTFFAVLKEDTEEVVQSLIYMGLIEPVKDMTPIKRMVSFLITEFRDKPIDVKAFDRVSDEIYLMFQQQPFRLPPQMTFIIKSLTTLDGIARTLDPQYNLLASAQPFIKTIALSQGNRKNTLGLLARQTKDFVQYKIKQPSKTEKAIKRLEEKLELGELQVKVRSVNNDRLLTKIYLGLKSLIYSCLTGFSFISGALFFVHIHSGLAFVLFGLSGLSCLFLIRSLFNLISQERIDRIL